MQINQKHTYCNILRQALFNCTVYALHNNSASKHYTTKDLHRNKFVLFPIYTWRLGNRIIKLLNSTFLHQISTCNIRH